MDQITRRDVAREVDANLINRYGITTDDGTRGVAWAVLAMLRNLGPDPLAALSDLVENGDPR